MTTQTEKEFHKEMVQGAARLNRGIGYSPTRFNQMVAEHGGPEAARRLLDYRKVGEEIWSRFNEGPEHQLWYYRSLVGIFTEHLSGAMTDELAHVVDDLVPRQPRFASAAA